MNILTVENDIILHLQADITAAGVKILSFPDNPTDFLKKFVKTTILVRYNGDAFDDPEANRNKKINQNRVVEWVVNVLARGLVGHTGAYTFIQQVRQSLTEYTVGTETGGATATALLWSSMMWPVTTKFLDEENGVWIYEMTFRHEIEETIDN